MTATLTLPTVATPPRTSTLPDGDALGNDILASAGQTATARLLRLMAQGGTSRKARRDTTPPRIMFQPRGWTLGGRVD